MPLIADRVLLKHFQSPDEIRTLPKTRIEIVHLGDMSVMRATFEPGWRWSENVKPAVGTESCQVEHLNYIISGRMKIHMDSGEEIEVGPTDVFYLASGHDAWVIGNEPVVALDFVGGKTYGKSI